MSTVLHAYPDSAAAHGVVRTRTAPQPQHILAATILASSLAFVDSSVVNVALPAIGRSFAADAAALQWCINAYLLPLSALLLLGGAAGDRFGTCRVLVIGVAVFALASLACALSPSLDFFLGARFCQGVGAALLVPNSLAILGECFQGAARGRAIGEWTAASTVAGAVGPVLGGWLVDLGSWRAIFLINLPLAAAAIVLAFRSIPGDAVSSGKSLDVHGSFLVTLGLGAVTAALTLASAMRHWTLTATVAALVGLLALLAFLLVERQRGDRAMMPLALLSSRPLVGLTLLTFLLYAALGALFVVLPYVLIEGYGYDATAAGAALLPMPIVVAVASPFAGTLAARWGPRLPLTLGSVVVGLGFLLGLRLDAHASYWRDVVPMVVVIAAGLSAAVAPLTTAVLSSVDASRAGAASGLNNAVARTGGLMATALLGAVFSAMGERLIASFHTATLICALAAWLAALCAFVLLPRPTPARFGSASAS
jgi:EmrB/QacA subfamily drug resistance transporter